MFALILSCLSVATYGADCYGTSCEGGDPVELGCAVDGVVVDNEIIWAQGYLDLGQVSLYYSQTCRAAWTQVTSNYNPTYINATVSNNRTGGLSSISGSGVSFIRSKMVYAQNSSASILIGSGAIHTYVEVIETCDVGGSPQPCTQTRFVASAAFVYGN